MIGLPFIDQANPVFQLNLAFIHAILEGKDLSPMQGEISFSRAVMSREAGFREQVKRAIISMGVVLLPDCTLGQCVMDEELIYWKIAYLEADRKNPTKAHGISTYRKVSIMTGIEFITHQVLNEAAIKNLPNGPERTFKINAAYNDAFRSGIGLFSFKEIPVPGKVLLVPTGVSIAPEDTPALLETVRDTPGLIDTPDHSEGMIMYGNQMIKWEIEYWDKEYEYGSPDPTDLSITNRVLILKNPLVD